jgi:hypothetical protein
LCKLFVYKSFLSNDNKELLALTIINNLNKNIRILVLRKKLVNYVIKNSSTVLGKYINNIIEKSIEEISLKYVPK